MLRIIAVLFGIVFIFVGIAGFFPTFKPNGLLLGWFEVDLMHNVFHLVSGIIAIMAATSLYSTRLYFQIFGSIYFIIAIIGFWRNGNLFIMHVNMADNFLHIAIGFLALYLGFFARRVRT